MKKWLLILMCSTLMFTVSSAVMPHSADAAAYAKTYKSPKGSFKQPATRPDTGVSKTQPGTGTKAPDKAAVTPTPKRGFTTGGFARGLFLGGIAGLLFGGMFGGMGYLGNLLGLFVNVAALMILFMIVRRVIGYFINRRRYGSKRY